MSKDHFVHDTGKGSRQRPVDKKKFDENWDRIFGRVPPCKEGANCLTTCVECRELTPTIETIYVCFKCNTVNNPDDNICRNCGEELWK